MQPEDIFNLERLLIGEKIPWIFLIEVIIRILFLYILIIVSMRLMGRRMASTLSRNETAALVYRDRYAGSYQRIAACCCHGCCGDWLSASDC